jgi:hypothetical protein
MTLITLVNLCFSSLFFTVNALQFKDLGDKLSVLEAKYNKQFKDVYEAINYLIKKSTAAVNHENRARIGFKTDRK